MGDSRPRARARLRLLPDDPDQGWMPYAWLVYLLFIPAEGIYRHFSPLHWAAAAAGIVVFLPLYFRAAWVAGREQVLIVAAMTALGAAFVPLV